MSENAIILCIVLVAVAVIAAIFIRRARRHRDAIGQTAPPEEITLEVHPKEQSAEDIYLLRFVRLNQGRTGSRRTIRVRTEYYDRIQAITRTIGDDRVTLIAYLDNVLKAHFDDNRESINTLYRKSVGEPFKTDE
ncbi:DUF3408 domain-containing protein [Parabacteroides faecis]|uniref:DUF3408 domain-containing protein n=1 Tax=Parabacteroides faecis TaxID=1217282 RepID=A0ABR6KUS9_9BACT|nr:MULTISPECIES: DUF3408 domain-containing protein [Parabacteroides]MBB4625181.1 hypothetical protein [Parabacteroides faecis]GGK19069.1 hypothetical protein GCM10007084_47920 [Parabacteroides faecis]